MYAVAKLITLATKSLKELEEKGVTEEYEKSNYSYAYALDLGDTHYVSNYL